VFGLVTLLAIGSGGFALEKTLISAREAKTGLEPHNPARAIVAAEKRKPWLRGASKKPCLQIQPPRRTIAPAAKLPLRSQEGAGNGPKRQLNQPLALPNAGWCSVLIVLCDRKTVVHCSKVLVHGGRRRAPNHASSRRVKAINNRVAAWDTWS
jgi:hypothetical protein